jgi:light-independent protochlorophyllide reductase B subunit
MGAIAAFEGVKEAATLLNGPIGCKLYVSYMANLLAPRFSPIDSNQYSNFYFGQRRVPCTYVDQQDLVYGTEQKVVESLKLIDSKNPLLIGVVNHSGTSLIGDDLNRFIKTANIKAKTVTIESSGFTGTFAYGFQNAAIKILASLLKKNPQKIPQSVNIIGYTIFHYNWENDVAEIKRMLNLLGVKVVSVICVDESISNIEKASQAELNLVVNEEYGNTIADYLKKEHGIPSLALDLKAPYGLTASEKWFTAVADFFKIPQDAVASESKRVRMKCYPAILRASSLNNNLRGLPFGIFGDSSQVAAVVPFVYEYLGIYPVVIGVKEVYSKSLASLKSYLAVNSLDTIVLVNPDQYEVLDCLNKTEAAIVFGSSVEEKISKLADAPPEFIPFSFPYYDTILLTMRPLIGFNGVLTFVEDILNSLRAASSLKKLNKPTTI